MPLWYTAPRQFVSFMNLTIRGSDNADILEGREGNDTIFAGRGDDVIRGGGGDDHIYAESASEYGTHGDYGLNDRVYGGAGNDTIDFSREDNWASTPLLSGEEGDDKILGGDGNDSIVGGSGQDYLVGNDGHDWIWGGDDNDHIFGGWDQDTLLGGAGDDWIFGGQGYDIIAGGEGIDNLTGGGGGTDIFVFLPGDSPAADPSNPLPDYQMLDTIHEWDSDDRIQFRGGPSGSAENFYTGAAYSYSGALETAESHIGGDTVYAYIVDQSDFGGGYLFADLNRDGEVDMAIRVDGANYTNLTWWNIVDEIP